MEQKPVKSGLVQLQEAVRSAPHFLRQGLWQLRSEGLSPLRRRLVQTLRFLMLVGEGYQREQIPAKSYALTYTTLLSLIPFLALTTVVLEGFGAVEDLKARIQTVILTNLIPSASESLNQRIDELVENVSFGSLGAIGLIGVVFTVLSGMKQLEDFFESIMRSPRRRTTFQRFVTYWSALTFGPLLLVASMSMQAAVMNLGAVRQVLTITPVVASLLHAMPVLLTCVLFWSVYQFLPSARIAPLSAALAGTSIGLLFELAKRTYYVAMSGSFQVNAIYGTIAFLPVTLVWCYFVWVLVLMGAVVTYTHQHRRNLELAKYTGILSAAETETLALACLLRLVRAFQQGEAAPTAEQLSAHFHVHPDQIESVLLLLERGGFILDGEGALGWLPRTAPERFSVAEVIAAVRQGSAMQGGGLEATTPEMQAARRLLEQEWQRFTLGDGQRSLAELAAGLLVPE